MRIQRWNGIRFPLEVEAEEFGRDPLHAFETLGANGADSMRKDAGVALFGGMAPAALRRQGEVLDHRAGARMPQFLESQESLFQT